MYRLMAALAACCSVRAGVVQGVALEQVSGRPLARTIIRLEPAPQPGNSRLEPLSTRAGRSGTFVFNGVLPGKYLLTALREGFFPAAYGARVATGHGTPFDVTADSTLFAELRLRHKGAVTGRVLDENGVGAAGVQVVAYRARAPLRSMGNAISDDRGVFRIYGLDPGKYWVRSDSTTLDDGSGWLPTFGPQSRESRDARVYQVTVDADTPDADVIPEPGTLFHLGGRITCDTDYPGPVTVILSSEMGRRRLETGCASLAGYRFEGLAPGPYQVFASKKAEDGIHAGYTELYLDHDTDSASIAVLQSPRVDIEIRRPGSNSPADVPVRLYGRRQDLAETETVQEITGSHVTLAPGHWEFRAQVPDGNYVESIASSYGPQRRSSNATAPTDWFDIYVDQHGWSRIRVSVSNQAGQITGRVMSDGKGVAAAPVFLWPVAEAARRSLGGTLQVLSDTEGHFRFPNLPPGDYRVLASFDVNEVDEDVVEMTRAASVHADASQTAEVELGLWVAP